MPNGFVAVDVDIFECPAVDELYLADKGTQITCGDVHGNVVKLLFLLVKHGIAKNLGASQYQ